MSGREISRVGGGRREEGVLLSNLLNASVR
jgi:hypothetical protein